MVTGLTWSGLLLYKSYYKLKASQKQDVDSKADLIMKQQ